MAKKTMTTAERLDLLLPWVNDDAWDERDDLPYRIDRFLSSFDGTEAAGFVRVVGPAEVEAELVQRPEFRRPDFIPLHVPAGTEDIDDYEVLHTALADLFQRGFPNEEPRVFTTPRVSVTLNVGIARRAPLSPRKNERRRLLKQPGAYVLEVEGNPFDLIVWLVMHLLTLPGSVVLMRCDAPKPHSTERCGRFFVRSNIGRRRDFCTDTCRQRKFWEADKVDRKGRAAAKRRKRRRK